MAIRPTTTRIGTARYSTGTSATASAHHRKPAVVTGTSRPPPTAASGKRPRPVMATASVTSTAVARAVSTSLGRATAPASATTPTPATASPTPRTVVRREGVADQGGAEQRARDHDGPRGHRVEGERADRTERDHRAGRDGPRLLVGARQQGQDRGDQDDHGERQEHGRRLGVGVGEPYAGAAGERRVLAERVGCGLAGQGEGDAEDRERGQEHRHPGHRTPVGRGHDRRRGPEGEGDQDDRPEHGRALVGGRQAGRHGQHAAAAAAPSARVSTGYEETKGTGARRRSEATSSADAVAVDPETVQRWVVGRLGQADEHQGQPPAGRADDGSDPQDPELAGPARGHQGAIGDHDERRDRGGSLGRAQDAEAEQGQGEHGHDLRRGQPGRDGQRESGDEHGPTDGADHAGVGEATQPAGVVRADDVQGEQTQRDRGQRLGRDPEAAGAEPHTQPAADQGEADEDRRTPSDAEPGPGDRQEDDGRDQQAQRTEAEQDLGDRERRHPVRTVAAGDRTGSRTGRCGCRVRRLERGSALDLR